MTDRELLELAAKAAGVNLTWRPNIFSDGGGEWPAVSMEDGCDSWTEWNPLTDDGDALRLAVKLRIDLDFDDLNPIVETYRKVKDGDSLTHCAALTVDPDAATRRAIVRAAAELGR